MAQAADKFQEQMDSMARRMVRTQLRLCHCFVCTCLVVLAMAAAFGRWLGVSRPAHLRGVFNHNRGFETPPYTRGVSNTMASIRLRAEPLPNQTKSIPWLGGCRVGSFRTAYSHAPPHRAIMQHPMVSPKPVPPPPLTCHHTSQLRCFFNALFSFLAFYMHIHTQKYNIRVVC